MPTADLEAVLRKKTVKRRIVCLAVCVLFLAIAIVGFVFLKKSSSELLGLLLFLTVIGFAIGFISGILLLTDFIGSPYKTFDSNGDFITIYRGFFRIELYVDGELQDDLIFGCWLEGTLKNGAKVHVSMGKWSSRMVFTDGRAPIDFSFWLRD